MADPSLSIVGPNSLTQQQILTWANQQLHRGSSALTDSLFDIIGFYINEGQTQGIRGDVAFAQACQETGYFGAPGAAPLLRKNNFAGIAVPSAFSAGDGFPTAQLGVRAHIQLLAKVVSGNSVPLQEPNVAPSWGGRQATTWGGLARNWAADPNYGQEIIAIFNSMLGANPVAAVGTQGVFSSVPLASVATALIPPIDPTWKSTAVVTTETLSQPLTGGGTEWLEAITTDSTVDLTVNQLSEIDLTLVDPDIALTAPIPALVDPATGNTQTVMFLGEIMNIDDINTIDVQGTGVPGVILRLRPRVLSWMNTQRVYRIFDQTVSAALWIEQRIAEFNATLSPEQVPATFSGQDTGVRTEAGPWLTLNPPAQGATQWQSYYDVAQQMANQDGAWLFEVNGGVFYGKPSWVATIGPSFKVGWPGLVPSKTSYAKNAVDVEMTSVPIFERSLQVYTGDTVQFYLPHNFGEQVRPGMNFTVQNVPPFWAGKTWLVNEVQWNLDGQQTDVRISANENHDPTPATVGNPYSASVFTTPPTTDPTGRPVNATATNAQFFATAMTQVAARTKYTWGGTNPQQGFDCSGLVMWCLAQLGIAWPHNSAVQYQACQASGSTISVAQAYNTLGALVFRNAGAQVAGEHEAICVGDGRSVLQAPHTGTVVSIDVVAQDYFQVAATIPGIQYSATQASVSPMGTFIP